MARNVAALLVLAGTLLLLVLLRPRPVPSTAGWCLAVANTVLLLACAVLNTANAVAEAQALTDAAAFVGYVGIGVSAAGTALSALRAAVNAFPAAFGTEVAVAVPLRIDGKGRAVAAVVAGGGVFTGSLAGALFFGTDAAVAVGAPPTLQPPPLVSLAAMDASDQLPSDGPSSSPPRPRLSDPIPPRAAPASPPIPASGPQLESLPPSARPLPIQEMIGARINVGSDGLSAFDRAAVEAVLRDFTAYEARSASGA